MKFILIKIKKIALLIIVLILLSGCGIYNLSNFVVPDDLEFIAVIESLNTPYKISEYMVENFEYEYQPLKALNPYQLWKIKKGDCNDMACFGHWVANYHGYETYQIEIKLKNSFETHWLAVYVEGDYSFTDNQFYFYGYKTFREIVEKSCQDNICYEWTSYKVFDYEMKVIESGSK